MGLKSFIKSNRLKNDFGFWLYVFLHECSLLKFRLRTDEQVYKKRFKSTFGFELNLKDPKTLGEKIQWIKLNERKSFHTVCADKYEVRNYLSKRFGDKYLIPLVYQTDDWHTITPENIIRYPCIVKANHTSGDYRILPSCDDVNWEEFRRQCHLWLRSDYYLISREWQYKNIKRRIVVEELLQTKDGKIPNDYKLHYFNSELKIVYVSVDREGVNKRNTYDADWNPLPFSWVPKEKSGKGVRGSEIAPPPTFDEMKRIGKEIAKEFKYVRVDFYDVDGKLYFGEITLHHGSGFDVFDPAEYDRVYGDMLKLQ